MHACRHLLAERQDRPDSEGSPSARVPDSREAVLVEGRLHTDRMTKRRGMARHRTATRECPTVASAAQPGTDTLANCQNFRAKTSAPLRRASRANQPCERNSGFEKKSNTVLYASQSPSGPDTLRKASSAEPRRPTRTRALVGGVPDSRYCRYAVPDATRRKLCLRVPVET